MLIPVTFLPDELKSIDPIDRRYVGEPFEFLKKITTPKQLGTRMEKLVDWYVSTILGMSIKRAPNGVTEYDRLIDGIRYEIKGATLGKGKLESFGFNQIRPYQDYDYVLFAMFYPNKMVVAAMTKVQVEQNVVFKVFKPQHGGKKAAEPNTFTYKGSQDDLVRIGAIILGETYIR